MTRERLRTIGAAVYGRNWKSAMGEDLGVTRQTVDNWDNGRHPPPGDISVRLMRVIRARQSGERRQAKLRAVELGRLIWELERDTG